MTKKAIKQGLLNELYAPYKQCMKCPLASLGRTHVVFGRGNPDARLVLIGEGPGKDEDLQGKPFIGRSGKLLSSVLEELKIPEQELYITNIVKCRPPKNRVPTTQEAHTCMNLFLKKQLEIIQPLVICTLGSYALQMLLDKTTKISKTRGIFLKYRSIRLIPTFHPAYIVRTPKELKNFVADLKKSYLTSNTIVK